MEWRGSSLRRIYDCKETLSLCRICIYICVLLFFFFFFGMFSFNPTFFYAFYFCFLSVTYAYIKNKAFIIKKNNLPFQSGKTYLSNFLADATEFSGGEYHPTQGCRLVCLSLQNGLHGLRPISMCNM